jgi:hypothetical protein
MFKLNIVLIAGMLGFLFVGKAHAYTITETISVQANEEQEGHYHLPNLIPLLSDVVTNLTLRFDVILTVTQAAHTSQINQPPFSIVRPETTIYFYGGNNQILRNNASVIVPVVVSPGTSPVVSIAGSAKLTKSVSVSLEDISPGTSFFIIDFDVSSSGFLPGIDFSGFVRDQVFGTGTVSLTYTLVSEPLGFSVVGLGMIRRRQRD